MNGGQQGFTVSHPFARNAKRRLFDSLLLVNSAVKRRRFPP
jgi:hypothetical protein